MDIQSNAVEFEIYDFNLIFFKVRRDALEKSTTSSDVVSKSAIIPRGTRIKLDYDKTANIFSGKMPLQITLPMMSKDDAVPKEMTMDVRHVSPLTRSGEVEVKWELGESFVLPQGTVHGMSSKFSVSLEVPETSHSGRTYPGHKFRVEPTNTDITVLSVQKYDIVKTICLQPISIVDQDHDPRPTGLYDSIDSMEMGMRPVDGIWMNAGTDIGGIQFQVNPWITKISRDLKVINWNADGESPFTKLKNTSDNCVEVLFVKSFDPGPSFGGAITHGSGQVNAKIIVTDQVIRDSRHKNVLAHELGHVLNLGHPGDSPGGSPNSVMCVPPSPMGIPSTNTITNIDKTSNPLWKSIFKPKVLRTLPLENDGTRCVSQ